LIRLALGASMVGIATPPTAAESDAEKRGRFPTILPDGLIAAGLVPIAFIVRWQLPSDGLFYDDAWQALGAWKGSLPELITVGQTQPGFTAGLMGWTRLLGVGTTALVMPALIAGTLGAPVLYIALRHFGYARSIALLLAAAVSSAGVHITYSSHVKTYTTDVLIIVGLAVAIWHLARRRWRESTAVAWLFGSVVVGSFSSIALVSTCVAGLMLVVHPVGDRRLRLCALAAQVVTLATLAMASSRSYSQELIHRFFSTRDGYIEFHRNPLILAREVIDHAWHVADVFPGGIPTLALTGAVVGILAAAWRGPVEVPARFFAVLVLVAAGASLVGLIPFGPPRNIGRVTLWMIPGIALGLAAVLELLRGHLASRRALQTGFDAMACAGAVLVLVSAFGVERPYPAGARSAIGEVVERVGKDDAIVITRPTSYSFALYADTPVALRPTPERSIGFLPDFSDDRIHVHDFTTTPEEFDSFVAGADHVYVVHAIIWGYRDYLFALSVDLALRGFQRVSTTTIRTGQVDVWRPAPTSRADSLDPSARSAPTAGSRQAG
jgi:hypothetical protein